MIDDEIQDGGLVWKPVLVPDSFFQDHGNIAAQLLVTRGDNLRVLGKGDHLVLIPVNVQQGDSCFGQRFQAVDGVVFVGEGLLLGQTVLFQNLLPVVRSPGAGARSVGSFSATGPTLEIAHGGVGINAGHLFQGMN